MLRMIQRSLRDFRSAYPKLLFFEYFFMLLTSVVIVPIITLIFNRVLTAVGTGTLMNEELSSLGLDWRGMLGLAAIGMIASLAVFIELSVLVILVQRRYFGQDIAIADAILTALRRTPRLFGFGVIQLFVLLLVLIPFVDSPLSASFYALFNVPIFVRRNIESLSLVMTVVYVLLLLVALYFVLRLIFVLHYIVLDGKSVGEAIRSSYALTRGKRTRVLATLFLTNALVIGIGFGTISSLSFLPYWIDSNVLKAFTDHYSLTLSTILTYMLTLTIMPINIILLTRLFYAFERDKGTAVRDQLQPAHSFIGQWEMKLWSIVKRVGHKRALYGAIAAIYAGLALFVGFKASDSLIYAKWSVLISAHRGDMESGPENSLPAIRGAIDKGIHAVEIDVQLTKDGIAVLHHDATLRRLAGVNVRMNDLSYAEVSKLTIGYLEDGTPVPFATLEEALAEAKDRTKLLLDLKPNGPGDELVRETIRLIHAYGMEEDVYIQSFDSKILRQIRSLSPDIQIGQIMYFALGNLSSLDVDFYTVEQVMVTEQLLHKAHAVGREVWVWTVNGTRDLKEVLKYEVDGIITDTPEIAQSTIGIDL